ncbi:MAG: hypothetical protein K1Y02_05845 [Candidatus Hydrogenedentes bacterium]|nr:hypothetical protein [Candidatus Hydrogenedentota bacterium]
MPKLQQREKVFLGVGAMALLFIVLFLVSQGPLEKYRRSATQLSAAKLRLQEAQLWSAEIETARQQVDSVKKMIVQQGGFDLWSHIDGVVKALSLGSRADIASKLGAASPTDSKVSAVELRLNGVNRQELVEVLYRIYANDYLIILDKVDFIRPAKDSRGLDCSMTFVSPRV